MIMDHMKYNFQRVIWKFDNLEIKKFIKEEKKTKSGNQSREILRPQILVQVFFLLVCLHVLSLCLSFLTAFESWSDHINGGIQEIWTHEP